MSRRDHEELRAIYARLGTIGGTAREAGCDRATVKAALGRKRAVNRERKPRKPSKLEPFRPMLRRLVEEDGLTAVLAHEELKAAGFDGGYSIVKVAVAKLRPKRPAKVTTVVEHGPGAEGQVDWSPYTVLIGGETRVVHAFSLVLPFSRYMFVRFAFDEQLETLVRLHEEAFADLDAVPREMTYDNMTTVGRHEGPDKVHLNEKFVSWGTPYGFTIRLTRPGRPNDHASVERPMHYIEHNCLARRRRRFADLDDLNVHAAWWCKEVANRRVHGTTRRRPVDQLQFERSFMIPLPLARPEPFQTLLRKVGSDFSVACDTNLYSVAPRHVGQEVTVRVYAERVEIWQDRTLLTTHVRGTGRHERFVLPEHAEEFQRLTPSRRLLESAFLRLGPTAEAYYQGLVAARGQGAGYHLKRILRMAERRGTSVVIGAMAHAARYGNYSADAVSAVITGASSAADPVATPTGEAPMPPERVRRWLEGLHVEQADLSVFDRRLREDGGEE